MLDDDAFIRIQRLKHHLLLLVFQVLDQIDDIVTVQFLDGIGKNRRIDIGENLVTNAFLKLGKRLRIQRVANRLDEAFALITVNLLKKVSEVSGVELGHKLADTLILALFERLDYLINEFRIQRVGFVLALILVFTCNFIDHVAPHVLKAVR